MEHRHPGDLPRPTAVPTRKKGPIWRELEGLVVLLQPDGTELLRLNRTASFLWVHLDGSRSVEELAELLATEFGVDREVAFRDTAGFLLDSEQAGLIEWQRA